MHAGEGAVSRITSALSHDHCSATLQACGNCLRKHPVVFRVPVSVDPDNKEGTEAVGGGAGGGAAAQSADARYQDISRVFGDSLLPYYSDMTQRICCHYI